MAVFPIAQARRTHSSAICGDGMVVAMGVTHEYERGIAGGIAGTFERDRQNWWEKQGSGDESSRAEPTGEAGGESAMEQEGKFRAIYERNSITFQPNSFQRFHVCLTRSAHSMLGVPSCLTCDKIVPTFLTC